MMGAPEEAEPEAGGEPQGETITVEIVCQHSPDGARTYLVGRAPEGEEEGAEALKPVASLDEALRAAKMLLQGGDEAADAQAEQEFAQGFSGGQAPAY